MAGRSPARRVGYDWHNIMHMIAQVISDDVYQAISGSQEFDVADYARRLAQLPGNWPPPDTAARP